MATKAKEVKQIKGIDVSHWQGNIDFNKVKAAGYDFVIIKAGGSDYGRYTDKKFKENYQKAVAAGLHVGAYYFNGPRCQGWASGEADAKHFLKILGDLKFDYPVFCDIEAQPAVKRMQNTEAVKAFCEAMESVGWWVGIYASDVSGFRSRLDHSQLKQFTHWVADYTDPVTVCTDHQMRQYTSKGKVPGISGSVDLDYSLIDYSATIKKKGLNNYKK